MADEMVISAEELAAKQAELKALEDKLFAMGKELVDTKPLWKSKIFWVNIAGLAAVVLDQFGPKYLSPDQLALVVGGLLPIVNVVFRYMNKDISGVTK